MQMHTPSLPSSAQQLSLYYTALLVRMKSLSKMGSLWGKCFSCCTLSVGGKSALFLAAVRTAKAKAAARVFILQSHNLIRVCFRAHLPSTHCFAFHFAVCLNWLKNKLLRLLFKTISIMLKLRSLCGLIEHQTWGERVVMVCLCETRSLQALSSRQLGETLAYSSLWSTAQWQALFWALCRPCVIRSSCGGW